jgi:lactoylglutathione lyase
MSLTRCHHHGFTVIQIERSLAFYRDLLGLELVRVSERRNLPSYDKILGYEDVALTVALLRHPVDEFLLELFEYHNPQGQQRPLDNTFVGAAHVAFEVDDIDSLYARLTAAGYGAINPPVDVERNGAIVARVMYALDPDGISVELFQEFGDLVAS